MNANSLIEDLIGNGKMSATLSRKERDKRLRKADIMLAAERVFGLKGYHDAVMQDIAREAQYATGTVYLYFKDKEALYFSLLEEKLNGLTDHLKESTGHLADAEEKLRVFVQESLGFFERNQDFFKILFSEGAKGQVVKHSKLSKSSVMLRHKEFVNELVRVGQHQKVIRSDFTSKQIADVFRSIFMTVIFTWLKDSPGDGRKLKDMSDFILDLFLNGAGRKR